MNMKWQLQGACLGKNDAMFPDNNHTGIAAAKKVCGGCPVRTACLIDALDTGDNEYGIRGALKPEERRAVHAITRDRHRQPHILAAAIMQVLHPGSAGRTLREVFDTHLVPLPGGHLRCRCGHNMSYQGRTYSANWVSWTLDRGREPVGQVRRMCQVEGCVAPGCLADNVERHVLKARAAA